jgi:hypothetical protein
MQRTKEEIGNSISYADSAYAACDEADALLILTDWAEFAQLDLKRLKSLLRYPIIVDGRNLYEPAAMKEAGIQYYSVGRPAVVLATKPVLVDAAKDPRISVETQNPHSAAPISFSVSVP